MSTLTITRIVSTKSPLVKGMRSMVRPRRCFDWRYSPEVTLVSATSKLPDRENADDREVGNDEHGCDHFPEVSGRSLWLAAGLEGGCVILLFLWTDGLVTVFLPFVQALGGATCFAD
jgi:hypothetical protein